MKNQDEKAVSLGQPASTIKRLAEIRAENEGGQEDSYLVAYEYAPITDATPLIVPTQTETDPYPTASSTHEPHDPTGVPEGDTYIDRRGYTPTDTSDPPCIIKVALRPFGNFLNIELKTKGIYHAWWYIIDGGAPHLVVGLENITISSIPSGTHEIEIYLTGAGNKKFPDTCTQKKLEFSTGADSTKTYILENCTQNVYISAKHRTGIQDFAYIYLDDDDYFGCWAFTSTTPGSVETLNTEDLKLGHIPVKYNNLESKKEACDCCKSNKCVEQVVRPIKNTNPVKPPPPPDSYPTKTSTEEFYTPPSIRCSAELIVKKQTDEILGVYGSESKKDAYLNVRGCPIIETREKYFVWMKRSDDCNENWINDGNPFLFEWISRAECNCTPYLIPVTSNIEKNLATDPPTGEEDLTSLKLNNEGSPVYIVHMLISTTNDATKAGQEFYLRYIRESHKTLPEISSTIIANNNTEKEISPGNIYFSPTDKNPNYFNASHTLDVGKTISRINRIYLSEPLK